MIPLNGGLESYSNSNSDELLLPENDLTTISEIQIQELTIPDIIEEETVASDIKKIVDNGSKDVVLQAVNRKEMAMILIV